MLGNILKAVVSVAVTPVALVADICTLPASSYDPHRGPFERTGWALKNAGECMKAAVEPQKENNHG